MQENESQVSPEIITSLVLQGDLNRLTDQQRVEYYRAFCDRLGLDPATQPFKLLRLSGKLILYCDRSGAQQLNRKYNVSHAIVAREIVNDCYVVTARAYQPNGRQQESIGAVPIKGVTGEALCNMMMKAETKAKRRSTLDLCGLGMLDETEVVGQEWTAKGETLAIDQTKPAPVPKIPQPQQPEPEKSPAFGETNASKKMEAFDPGIPTKVLPPPVEEWETVTCTYGKRDGAIRGKSLGFIAKYKPEAMTWLYQQFVDPQELKTIAAKDKPMRQALIDWNTAKLEKAFAEQALARKKNPMTAEEFQAERKRQEAETAQEEIPWQ
jgi:hypothetical protein